MAAILNLTSFDAALKVHYTDQRVKNLVYKNNPWLGIIPKMESFGGKNLPIPIQYGVPMGRSATFAKAQANKYSSNFEDFVLTRVQNYALADIDNETLEASMGNANAFLEAATNEIDGALHAATRDLASDMFRSGTGSRGRISSIGGAGHALTLSSAADIVNFEVGMVLLTSTQDGVAVRNASAKSTITSIDRAAGIIHVATAVTSFAATDDWAAGDYLYVEGDAQNGSTKLKLSGLDAWVPASAPGGSDSFFGVNRSVDSVRLAGLRVTGTDSTVEEALITCAAKLYREGGTPDIVLLNPEHHADLDKTLSGRMRYDSVRASDADIAYESIRLRTAAGSVSIIADPNCPKGVAYMLQTSTWKLYSLGPAPKILRSDGLKFLRNSSSDSVEVRCGYYAQMGCQAPGWNARVSLAL